MRAFLSLFPDPQNALAIEQWAASCWPNIQRRVPAQNLHITLAFLGNIDQSVAADISDMIAEKSLVAAFSMTFDQVGYWPQPQVLWLGAQNPTPPVNELAEGCRSIANRAGISVKGRQFEPHITLARKPSQPPQAPLLDPSFTIEFDTLCLCESFLDKRGARYQVREAWPLS
ncbi:MAG: RNA 2',3'-cyclic phosphodiesterase [Pseudomonadota bacterium]